MIPNIVTSVRIVLAPFILIALSHNNFYLFFILMSIAAASDMLDGMLARMLNQRTVVGQLLDPLADKFLIDSLFLALYMRGSVPIWIALIVILRDGILITGITLIAIIRFIKGIPIDESSWKKLTPSHISKLNTFFQILTIVAALVRIKYQFPGLMTLFFITALLTILSMIHYVIRGINWGFVLND